MPHRVNEPPPLPPPPTMDADMERQVAETSQAFATPSRVRILARLWHGPASVSALATAVGMEQSAVSHQLRLLRGLRLVNAEREGRHMVYRLSDDHVAIMLKEAIYHVEHLRMEAAGQRRAAARDARREAARRGQPEVVPVG